MISNPLDSFPTGGPEAEEWWDEEQDFVTVVMTNDDFEGCPKCDVEWVWVQGASAIATGTTQGDS